MNRCINNLTFSYISVYSFLFLYFIQHVQYCVRHHIIWITTKAEKILNTILFSFIHNVWSERMFVFVALLFSTSRYHVRCENGTKIKTILTNICLTDAIVRKIYATKRDWKNFLICNFTSVNYLQSLSVIIRS